MASGLFIEARFYDCHERPSIKKLPPTLFSLKFIDSLSTLSLTHSHTHTLYLSHSISLSLFLSLSCCSNGFIDREIGGWPSVKNYRSYFIFYTSVKLQLDRRYLRLPGHQKNNYFITLFLLKKSFVPHHSPGNRPSPFLRIMTPSPP